MKLQQQVTSLEISKRIKELGTKQESYFYHLSCSWGMEIRSWEDIEKGNIGYSFDYSAFTVAELGEMLGYKKYECHTAFVNCGKGMTWICISNTIRNEKEGRQYADTEADARGKMLIYLLENNLIPCP